MYRSYLLICLLVCFLLVRFCNDMDFVSEINELKLNWPELLSCKKIEEYIPAVAVNRYLSPEAGDFVARQRDCVDKVISMWPEVGVAGVRAPAQLMKTSLIHSVLCAQAARTFYLFTYLLFPVGWSWNWNMANKMLYENICGVWTNLISADWLTGKQKNVLISHLSQTQFWAYFDVNVTYFLCNKYHNCNETSQLLWL